MLKRADHLHVHQAIQAPLAHPLSEQDVRYIGGTYARLWGALLTPTRSCAQSRQSPLATRQSPIVLMAVPATEARCDRVIGALRRIIIIFPFSCHMSEETILGRIAVMGQ
jgi:hypothetical protein